MIAGNSPGKAAQVLPLMAVRCANLMLKHTKILFALLQHYMVFIYFFPLIIQEEPLDLVSVRHIPAF